MFITTTQWDSNPTDELIAQFEAKSAELAGDFVSTKLLDRLPAGGVSATRTWPDQATADAWCAFVLGLGATNATAEPYTP
jgi:hypothetical protein